MRFFSPDAWVCRRRYRDRSRGARGLWGARRPAVGTIGHCLGGVSPPERSLPAPVWNPATGKQQVQVLLATGDEVTAAVRSAATASLFGDTHVHGEEGVTFYTGAKVVTSRWPHVADPTSASFSFPTSI